VGWGRGVMVQIDRLHWLNCGRRDGGWQVAAGIARQRGVGLGIGWACGPFSN